MAYMPLIIEYRYLVRPIRPSYTIKYIIHPSCLTAPIT